ncbi:hypothetical protein [Lamprobacter modestohalophilus]|nr:hypothetical protein [Lamprobacter modestohalophilus]
MLAQMLVGPLHVTDDDGDVLEPAVVAARIGRDGTALRHQVFDELDALLAQTQARAEQAVEVLDAFPRSGFMAALMEKAA